MAEPTGQEPMPLDPEGGIYDARYVVIVEFGSGPRSPRVDELVDGFAEMRATLGVSERGRTTLTMWSAGECIGETVKAITMVAEDLFLGAVVACQGFTLEEYASRTSGRSKDGH